MSAPGLDLDKLGRWFAAEVPGAVLGEAVTDASLGPGYLTENEILHRYATSSDRDLSRFGWYRGLAAFKLAAILEGIHYRFLAGHTIGEGFDGIAEAIDPLLEAGLSTVDD